MTHRLAVAVTLIILSCHAYAEPVCDGWSSNKEKITGDLESNMKKLEKEYNLQFEKVSGAARCGTADVWLVKYKGQAIVEIPVPKAANGVDVSVDAFVARVKQVRRTSVSQLLALRNAETSFKRDVELLMSDWGVTAEIPKGSLSEKTADNGQEFVLQIQAPKCQKVAGDAVHNGPEKIGELKVPAFYYVPNRRRYDSANIYRDAQLRFKLLKGNPELLAKIAARAEQNANQCEGSDQLKWGQYAAKLKALAPTENPSSTAQAPADAPPSADQQQ